MAFQLLSVIFFLLLDAAFYFASGSLLYFQHVSNDKNSSMKIWLESQVGKGRGGNEDLQFYLGETESAAWFLCGDKI